MPAPAHGRLLPAWGGVVSSRGWGCVHSAKGPSAVLTRWRVQCAPCSSLIVLAHVPKALGTAARQPGSQGASGAWPLPAGPANEHLSLPHCTAATKRRGSSPPLAQILHMIQQLQRSLPLPLPCAATMRPGSCPTLALTCCTRAPRCPPCAMRSPSPSATSSTWWVHCWLAGLTAFFRLALVEYRFEAWLGSDWLVAPVGTG